MSLGTMSWPDVLAYQEAIQNPKRCFKDSDLKDGRVTVDARGWPKAATGNFAAVYQVSSPNGQQWAVKCFTREVPGLRDRYRAISDHVQRAGLPFMVQFQFLEEGIRVKGRFYPILKMQWVKGDSLNGFVRAWLHKQDKLLALAQLWLRLAEDLRAKQIGHGDLQHGNVLLVPGTKPGTVLKLIDYDGMYVPALAQTRSAERGHPNYQHPERLRQGYYGPEVDRFSHLVVYTALRCLVVEPALWDQFNNDENLLFVEKDFESPSNSRLFQRLWGLTDANIRNLVGHLLLSASRPVNRTPLLRDLVNNGQVRPLSRDDEKEIERLLASPPRPVPANNNPAVVGSGTAKTLPTVAPSPGTRPATGPIPPWLSQVPPAAVPAASAPPPSSPSTVPSRWLRWLQAAIRDPNRRGILMLAVLIPAIPLAYLFGDWLSGRLVPSRGRHLPVVATEPLNQPPGTNINQAPSVAIATTDPGEPVAGQAFTIRLQGRDPDGDSVTFEYRRVGDANWQAAPQGQVRLDRVEPGVLELEFRAVDHRGAASAAIRRAWQVPDEVRRFTGHTDGVSSVAFSPDGRYALSGSWDQTLRLWKVATGKEVRRFTGHTDWVNSVAFSPDGRYALSASWDKTLRLWEVAMGQEVHHFEGHTGPVNSVAFSPDGRYALSGSADQTLRLWEAATGQEVRRFTGHTGGVNSVAFSPDGRYALSASWDQTLRLWEVATGQEVRRFTGHTDAVTSVAFSSDGRYALSGSDDTTLRLWEVATGQEVRRFTGHTLPVLSVAFFPDGRYALSGSWDNTLRLWALPKEVVPSAPPAATPRKARPLNQPPKVAVAATEPFEPVASQPFTIRLRGSDPDGDSITFEYRVAGESNWQAAAQGQVRLERVEPGVLELEFRAVDNRGAASAAIRRAWQVSAEVRRFTGHDNAVTSVAFSPDGRYALSASWDQTLRLWEVATGKEVRRFEGNTGPVNSVAFSSDGRYALLGSWDRTLRLWEAATGKEVRRFTEYTWEVRSVAFSPDGRYALSGSGDNTLLLWEVATGQEVRRFQGHDNAVTSVAFSPDGRYALSGSADQTLRLWEVATGKEVRSFTGHTDSVWSVAFSPDSRYALSGSYDKTLRLWEAATGKEVRRFTGHTHWVRSVAFSPDGRYALSGSDDKTLRLWALPKEVVPSAPPAAAPP